MTSQSNATESSTKTNKTYVVKPGDTLEGIAKEILGDRGKWTVIARANRIENPNKLEVGARLQIPAA